MGKRILLACKDVPGWGGASTVLYLLFERMQRDGFDVAYVNLVGASEEAFVRRQFGDRFANPRGLDSVHTCILEEPFWGAHGPLGALIATLSPDLLLGFGFIAALLLRLAAPRLPVVFMTAGSRELQRLIEAGAVSDFMGFQRSVARGVTFPVAPESRERQAAEGADLIIAHSPVVRCAFEQLLPPTAGKIYANTISIADFVYAEAEELSGLRLPAAQRDIDVIFVASSWKRPIKNYALVRQIASRCDGVRVHIIGEVERECPSARHHGIVARRADLYGLLGRARTLVCPSLLDAAPAVLFEASAMGCNVVASPNCGNWQLCNSRLVADHGTRGEFLSKIELSLGGPYTDNRERFRGGYADLVDTLSVF